MIQTSTQGSDSTVAPLALPPIHAVAETAVEHRSEADEEVVLSANSRRTLSFVVPVKDEEATIAELYRRISQQVEGRYEYEVIFVDDGSQDASWFAISELARREPERVRGIRFRRHAGKAAALAAGFRAARGNVVFTLDADLQDDPGEIPRFLQRLDEGYDLVSGWKKVRHDPWHKVWPSRLFNAMISRLGGVVLHDHNCGFKCYRAEVARSLMLYGELHRMIPSLAAMKGYRAAEIEVRHHPRLHGRSKYGFERFLRGFFDMFTIWFLRRFSERPLHMIGGFGLAMLGLGGLTIAGAWFTGMSTPMGTALVTLGAALAASGPLLVALGLVAELLNRGGLQAQWELCVGEDTAVGLDSAKAVCAPGGVAAVAPPSLLYSCICRRTTDAQPKNGKDGSSRFAVLEQEGDGDAAG